MIEDGQEKPLGRLYERVGLDCLYYRETCNCSFTAFLVTTELKLDGTKGRHIHPYLHHALIIEPANSMEEGRYFQRIGVEWFQDVCGNHVRRFCHVGIRSTG